MDTQIKNAKSNDRQYILADGDKLNLIISPTGNKSWQVRYKRPFLNTTGKIALGKYPELSLKEARKQRDEINKLLINNIDPKDHRNKIQKTKEEELSNTFLVFANKWRELQSHSVKEETIKRSYQILERHVLPALGNVPIASLTQKMLSDQIAPLKARGSFETIKKLLTSTNQIMRIAVNEGVIEFNKFTDLTKNYPTPKTEHQPTIRPEELPELMKAIAGSRMTKTTQCLVEWQLRTLSRPGECSRAKWEDIDFKELLWIIPAEQTKMNREHKVPLTPQMEQILRVAKNLNVGNSVYIFQSHKKPNSPLTEQTANKAIKDMGFGRRLVAHGLRALASTAMNEHGFDKDIIESALAHLDKDASRRPYNRAEYIEPKRKLLKWWSDYIDEAATCKNTI